MGQGGDGIFRAQIGVSENWVYLRMVMLMGTMTNVLVDVGVSLFQTHPNEQC